MESGLSALLVLASFLMPAVHPAEPTGGNDGAARLGSFLTAPSGENAEALRNSSIADVEAVFASVLSHKETQQKLSDKVTLGEDYYLYQLPDEYDPGKAWPLMISLHGNPPRHCERVHHKYWRGDTARHGFILISPNLDGGRWHRPIGEEKLFKALKDAVIRFHIDGSRIYVGGYSAGASGAWNIMTRYADIFAGAVIRCGKRRVSNAMLKNLKGKGIFIIHATEDDKCPVSQARNAVKALNAYGVAHRYVEYPHGHDFYWHSNDDVLEFLGEFSNPKVREFKLRGLFRAEHRILHYLSVKGGKHVVEASSQSDGFALSVSRSEDLSHVDLYFSDNLVEFGKRVSIEFNGTKLEVVPKKSLAAFIRAWRLYPFYQPGSDEQPFTGGCRLVEDGKLLESPKMF